MMTLEAAAVNFWAGVRELLIEKYRHDERRAAIGIDELQREAERHGFIEAVFNQGEEQTAAAVDGIIHDRIPQLDGR